MAINWYKFKADYCNCNLLHHNTVEYKLNGMQCISSIIQGGPKK